jgi:hypothetical protein
VSETPGFDFAHLGGLGNGGCRPSGCLKRAKAIRVILINLGCSLDSFSRKDASLMGCQLG